LDTNYTISTKEFESIEQYLLGKISKDEQLVFERKIAEDSLLSSKVNEVNLLLAGIETASLKKRLDSYHLNLKKNLPEKGSSKVISMKSKLMVAASVALLAVSVWLFMNTGNKYETLYAAYYKPDPGLMSAMGIGDNYAFNKAMLDYKTGNFKKAVTEWSKLKTDMPQNDTLNYFLGAAQQADGNNTAAVNLLKPLATDTARSFYKEACWYTGLALLQQGEVKEAIPYLEKSGRPERIELISKLK